MNHNHLLFVEASEMFLVKRWLLPSHFEGREMESKALSITNYTTTRVKIDDNRTSGVKNQNVKVLLQIMFSMYNNTFISKSHIYWDNSDKMKLQTVSLNVTFRKASKQCVKKHVQKT